jgi:hypothetical protein
MPHNTKSVAKDKESPYRTYLICPDWLDQVKPRACTLDLFGLITP